ncbi:XdhC family protein [Magnetococcus sp. PR-3]|uniref:XdhC family protein n=1 Tax=Magnetococcus sp. PR-3 TaxID=3120355 RepID=UPI002FCE4613
MVSVWDPCPANAQRRFFMKADHLLQGPVMQRPAFIPSQRVDAAVLMSHNISLDAQALVQLNGQSLTYLALLGPINRRKWVIQVAGLQNEYLHPPLCGPAGLNIGGELPESMALSILAEAHAALYQ